jgi:tRNA A37 threonylcarbamoyladenosine dehydratase
MSNLGWLTRTQILIGEENIQKLQSKHVLIVGLGGVGSYAAEFISRAGVGSITIVDGDVVDPSNRNRQLPALATTHGLPKADIMYDRLLAINPELNLISHRVFVTPDMVEQLLFGEHIAPFDYVMDCIDSLTPKLTLLEAAYRRGIPIVSSMGAGGKLDPTRIRVADIKDTKICPFARYVRRRLRYKGIQTGIKAVYSTEPIIEESLMMTDGSNYKKSAYGTISYLPAAFGGACASVVIRDLLGYAIHGLEASTEIAPSE